MYRVREFEAYVGSDGVLAFPKAVVRRLPRNRHYVVRLSEGTVNPAFRRRGITEDDIEEIARVQLEPRENVVRFLLAEGRLAGNDAGYRRRKPLR